MQLEDAGENDGTGVGLTIARQLSETLGGDLQVESVVGRGSVFTLTIRAAVVNVAAELAA